MSKRLQFFRDLARRDSKQNTAGVDSGQRNRSRWRVFALGCLFLIAYAYAGAGVYSAVSGKTNAVVRRAHTGVTYQSRPPIYDRDGRLLAGQTEIYSLYATAQDIRDPDKLAHSLVDIFPRKRASNLKSLLSRKSGFVWLVRKVTPNQRTRVLDLGEPGLHFGSAQARFYPGGRLASQILGGVRIEDQATDSICYHGFERTVERWLDRRIPDCQASEKEVRAPDSVHLSISVPVQYAMRELLAKHKRRLGANWASAVIMEADSGAIVGAVSLPDFDVNRPVLPLPSAQKLSAEELRARHPRTNHLFETRFEHGSMMKLFTIAASFDSGLVDVDSKFDVEKSVTVGSKAIIDKHKHKRFITPGEAVIYSSNNVLAQIAEVIGPDYQRSFFERFGFDEPVSSDILASVAPDLPTQWTKNSAKTIAYGHGIEISSLHLLAATAPLVNGGWAVTPTFLLKDPKTPKRRIISPEISEKMRNIMRAVVANGTGRRAQVAGYEVGGKTGTADKRKPTGGYYEDRVRAGFIAAFPMSRPRYLLLVVFDEPEDNSGSESKRTADITAAPVAGEIIKRLAPMLGLLPAQSAHAGSHL